MGSLFLQAAKAPHLALDPTSEVASLLDVGHARARHVMPGRNADDLEVPGDQSRPPRIAEATVTATNAAKTPPAGHIDVSAASPMQLAMTPEE